MEKILIVVVVFAVILFFWKKFTGKREEDVPYKKKDFLLNIPERKFFEKVIQIIPNNYVIFPQIVLSSIVKTDVSKNKFWKYQNKINKKTIDFVVFKVPYLVPVLGIEYDGCTHKRNDRMERDLFVNRVLGKSGISIMHIEHSKNINYKDIEKDIISILKSRENN